MVHQERAIADLPQGPAPRELREQLGFGVGEAEKLAGVVDFADGSAVDDLGSMSASRPSARRT